MSSRNQRLPSFRAVLGFIVTLAGSAAAVGLAQGAGFGSGVGIGIQANGACLAGTCPPTPTPGNSSNVLPFSFVVTLANGDRYRVTGSSGVGSDSAGFNCGGSQNFSIAYLGNAAGTASAADTITVNGLWACATTASSTNTTHPFSVYFSTDVPASSSVTMAPVYNGLAFPTRGPFSPPTHQTSSDFMNVPVTGGVFASNTTYLVKFGAGTPIGATIWAGYSSAAPGTVVSSVLPSARTSSNSGGGFPTVTAFATIINADTTLATSCSLSLPSDVPGTFLFQATNPLTNEPIGTPNTLVDIGPGQAQTFYFAVTPASASSSDIPINANCLGRPSAIPLPGVNTFVLTSSNAPLADMVSIGVTPSADGVIRLPGTTGSQVFATATVNIGAAGAVTVKPTDTAFGQPPRNLPVSLAICQTNASGACLQPPAPSVTATPGTGQSLTFTVVATGQGTAIPFDPSKNRVFLYLSQGTDIVGATSAAIRTP